MIRPPFVYGQRSPLRSITGAGIALLLFTICPPVVALHEIAPVVNTASNSAILLAVSMEPDVEAYAEHPSAGSSDLAPTVYAGGCCYGLQ